jgi:NAD(P)-dependent dehydrogenase (short-subunit alcohol dehydrogenase family)
MDQQLSLLPIMNTGMKLPCASLLQLFSPVHVDSFRVAGVSLSFPSSILYASLTTMAPVFFKRAKQTSPPREAATYKLSAQLTQIFPPRPTFTEKDIPFQKGKVYLITGGTSGIGLELAKILYARGATVYVTGRTEEKAKKAVEDIQKTVPEREGRIDYILLNLDDLSTIKASVEAFKEKESKLDVLWNNAGIAQPPAGSLTKQGFELQLATNCLGPFLLTHMMLPLLDAAVEENGPAFPGAVRVVWLSSQVAELSSPPEGIVMTELSNAPQDNVRNYLNSKVGCWFLSAEFARRYGDERRIVSVAMNPGNANTNLLKDARWTKVFTYPLQHSPKLAALTELYAGLSPDVNLDNNGCYVMPWGRIHTTVPPHLLNAMRLKEIGGTSRAKAFYEFCEDKTKDYY